MFTIILHCEAMPPVSEMRPCFGAHVESASPRPPLKSYVPATVYPRRRVPMVEVKHHLLLLYLFFGTEFVCAPKAFFVFVFCLEIPLWLQPSVLGPRMLP